jgi:hypothetical protein
MACSASAAQRRFLTQKQKQMAKAVQEVCTAFAGKPEAVLISVTMAAKCMGNFKEIFAISSEAANVRALPVCVHTALGARQLWRCVFCCCKKLLQTRWGALLAVGTLSANMPVACPAEGPAHVQGIHSESYFDVLNTVPAFVSRMRRNLERHGDTLARIDFVRDLELRQKMEVIKVLMTDPAAGAVKEPITFKQGCESCLDWLTWWPRDIAGEHSVSRALCLSGCERSGSESAGCSAEQARHQA